MVERKDFRIADLRGLKLRICPVEDIITVSQDM